MIIQNLSPYTPINLAFKCAFFAANRLKKCSAVQKIYVKNEIFFWMNNDISWWTNSGHDKTQANNNVEAAAYLSYLNRSYFRLTEDLFYQMIQNYVLQ